MKFAKIVFWSAGIWGILVFTPLYFIFDLISKNDPPPITHPAFYYGFVGVALAWQIAFMIIASNPVRFRPIMIAGIVEKFGYAATLTVLYLQRRLHPSDLTFGAVDLLFGILFVVAFLKTKDRP
jgi:vacuolar-type H+-ATPase subunit I/STV1